MTDKDSRRKFLGWVAGSAGVVGVASLWSSSRKGSPAQSNKSDKQSASVEQPQPCSTTAQQTPGSGEVNTHVITKGSHRGENNFSYFLDRASLGLDTNQPDEVYTQVYVKFDKSWQQPTDDDTCKVHWAGGNLSAGAAGQGGTAPTGQDGWSVRVYTRGPVTNGNVSVGSYVYHLDQQGRYGSLWQWPDAVAIDAWNKIETYVKLNSVSDGAANRDGIVRTWLNDTLQTNREDVRWRTSEALGIDRLGPGSYWGGFKDAPHTNILYYDLLTYTTEIDDIDISATPSQTQTPTETQTSGLRNN